MQQLGHGKTPAATVEGGLHAPTPPPPVPQNEHFPAMLVGLKKTRRDVFRSRNNCTLILAGCFNSPLLQQKCMEVAVPPQLMAQLGE